MECSFLYLSQDGRLPSSSLLLFRIASRIRNVHLDCATRSYVACCISKRCCTPVFSFSLFKDIQNWKIRSGTRACFLLMMLIVVCLSSWAVQGTWPKDDLPLRGTLSLLLRITTSSLQSSRSWFKLKGRATRGYLHAPRKVLNICKKGWKEKNW